MLRAGERRRAERRIGDPGMRRGVAFSGGSSSPWKARDPGCCGPPLTAAEQAARRRMGRAAGLPLRRRRTAAAAAVLLVACRSSTRTGRRLDGSMLADEKRRSQTRGGEDRPASQSTLQFQHSPLPVRCGFCPAQL